MLLAGCATAEVGAACFQVSDEAFDVGAADIEQV